MALQPSPALDLSCGSRVLQDRQANRCPVGMGPAIAIARLLLAKRRDGSIGEGGIALGCMGECCSEPSDRRALCTMGDAVTPRAVDCRVESVLHWVMS